MSGIYLHIPFCAKACHYCDFHFSTNLSTKSKLLEMMTKELALREDYLPSAPLSSIYFGGGTPSLLSIHEISTLMDSIHQYFSLAPNAEITLEANPDDLTNEKLLGLTSIGINRLSIGIQSFNDDQLRYMNRLHTSKEAIAAVKNAQEAGFSNLSIDLIYGIPSPDHSLWKQDLQTALDLQVQHISSYCLTIEPNTVFGKRKAKGVLPPEDEEYNACQFELLQKATSEAGFEQYEVSNFALPGFYARHNSSYWLGEPYLGIGPAAHSYDLFSRQYNVENNYTYTSFLKEGKLPYKKEVLTLDMRANEYIMTGLRTKWGVDLEKLTQTFGIDRLVFLKKYQKYLQSGHLIERTNSIVLTQSGQLLADKISSDLFMDNL